MFCNNCGKEVSGKFCSNCGAALEDDNTSAKNTNVMKSWSGRELTLWSGQPDGLIDKVKTVMKVNSIYYEITNQRILITTGLLGRKHDEIELYKIQDYKITQTVFERLLNIGNLIIFSADNTTPQFVLRNIKNPNKVKEILRTAVLEFKQNMNISYVVM